MAKKNATNCGFKYRFEWEGQETGYSYRLDVIPSYADDPGATLTVSNEFNGALKDFEFIPFEFDKYNFGTGAAPSLKLQFDLSLCSDNLADVLIEPFADVTYESLQFIAGNIFELSIKFNGLSGESTYRRVYRGCQTNTIAQDFDATENTYSVETSNILFEILRQLKIEDYANYVVSNPITPFAEFPLYPFVTNIYERLYPNYQHYNYFGGGAGMMENWQNFTENFETFVLGIFRVFMRNSALTTSNGCSLVLPLPILYKQNTAGSSNTATVALAADEIYFVAFAGNAGDAFGAFQELKTEYPTFWDFIVDYAQSCLVRCNFQESLTTNDRSELAFQYLYNALQSTDIPITKNDAVFKPSCDILQTVEAVSIELVDDSVDKVVSTNKTARSGEKYSIPVAFYNTPIIPNSGKFKTETTAGTTTCVSNKIGFLQWFYHNTDIVNCYLRVNEYCDQQISTTRNISDFAGIGTIDWAVGGLQARSKAAFTSGIFQVMANGLLAIFSDNAYETLCKIECNAPLYAQKVSSQIHSVCLRTDNRTTVDLSVFEPKANLFSDFPTNYLPLKCMMDKTEICKLTLISQQIP